MTLRDKALRKNKVAKSGLDMKTCFYCLFFIWCKMTIYFHFHTEQLKRVTCFFFSACFRMVWRLPNKTRASSGIIASFEQQVKGGRSRMSRLFCKKRLHFMESFLYNVHVQIIGNSYLHETADRKREYLYGFQ